MRSRNFRFHFSTVPMVVVLSFVALALWISSPGYSQDRDKDGKKEEVMASAAGLDSYRLEIRILEKDGNAKIPHTPIFPSFSHPRLKFTDFQVKAIQRSGSDGYQCTVLAKGLCFSPLANSFSLADSNFQSARAFLNGDDAPLAKVPIKMERTQERNQVSGSFDVKIKNVAVTEGLNTFRISVPDPVTSIRGGQTVTFVVNGGDLDTTSPNPTIEDVEYLEEESVGEFFQFRIGVKGIPEGEADKLKVSLGAGSNSKIYDLIPISSPGYYMLGQGKKSLAFCLLPSKKGFNPGIVEKAARGLQHASILSTDTEMQVPDRFQFLAGYGRGAFINGGDLLAGNGDLMEGAVAFSSSNLNGEIQGHWIKENKIGDRISIPLPTDYKAKQMDAAGLNASPELLWQISKLYREHDPRAEDVTLALLVDDYASLGIDIDLSGWRSDFFGKISEPLDAINSLCVEDSRNQPMFHGFLIGVLVATASQVDLPPTKSEDPDQKWSSPPMSEVLQHSLKVFETFPPITAHNPKRKAPKVKVPEKYAGIWPWVSIYYIIVWEDDQEMANDFSGVLPDSIKHPLLSPIFLILALLGIFGGAIWLLVEEFKISLGWGFGQLVANTVGCCLIIPGPIVGFVFLCLHWKHAKLPFLVNMIGWVFAFLALLFIPSWTKPV